MSSPQDELEKLAKGLLGEALSSRPPLPAEVSTRLVLGTFFEGPSRIFEVYLPGNRPEDAIVRASVVIDVATRKAQPVEINEEFEAAVARLGLASESPSG